MTYHSDHHNGARDTTWRPVGNGLDIRHMCMGCNLPKKSDGGRGKAGPRWRCAECVAKKEAKQ